MATIYRFIIEQKAATGGDGRRVQDTYSKSAAKKGRYVSFFGGEKGGVEHNRKLRAINPLLNRMTGGAWEKGMRIGRAATGLVKYNTETGKIGISGPAIAIIIAFVLQILMKQLKQEQLKAEHQNMQNFKQLENGIGAIHGQFKVTSSFWTGLYKYNENK